MMAALVEGAALSRSGAPEKALALLLPLVGQLIDVHARDLLHEEAVISAITAARWKDALWLLDVWLRDVLEEDQPAVLEIVKALLNEIPPGPLEEELQRRLAVGDEAQTQARALEKMLVRHLASAALARQDSDLARRLLDRPGVLPLLGEGAAALLELAARHDVPQVNGRQIGLYFPDESPELAERGALLSRGALAALQAFRDTPPRLVVRQAPLASAPRALAALDAEGVLVLVGGADPESAEQLARFSEQEQIAALLLVPPASTTPGRWALRFGPLPDQAAPELLAALTRRGAQRPLVVGPSATPGATPCLALPPPGQLARYPVRSWKSAGVDALLLLGSPRCAQDVLDELRGAGVSLRIALGPEASALTQPLPRGAAPTRRTTTALASGLGCFPQVSAGEAPLEGAPGYWQRLALDAAHVAALALAGLPEDRTLDGRKVRQRRESVREALERADPSPCMALRPSPRMTSPPWRVLESR